MLQNSTDAEQAKPHRERLFDLWLTMAMATEQANKDEQILVCYSRAKEQLDQLCADFPESKKYAAFQQKLDGQIKKLQAALEPPKELSKPNP